MQLSDYIDDAVYGKHRTITIGRASFWWPFPVAAMLGSSGAIIFGCPVYGANASRFIKGSHRIFHRAREVKFWVKYRLFPTRYHWVNTGLHPGYYDADEVMLHAMMACLGRYIEEMGGLDKIDKFNAELRDPEHQDKNAPEGLEIGQADSQESAADIWRWWTVTRPAEEARRDELLMILYGNRKIETKPTDNPHLLEYVPPRFEDDAATLHAEFRALEAKIEDDTQAMLHRLIDIRRSLWV